MNLKGNPNTPGKKMATLSWSDLSVTVADKKGTERHILRDINGYVEPGHMLAIMGPSGCGKSTLLDSLAGRLAGNAKMKGSVLLNGKSQQISFGIAAYVTQDDVLIGTLTVYETILYSAMLRLPTSMSKSEKISLVDSTIQEIGLEDAKNTPIGNWHMRGISGGQKRRVSIALELITKPVLLFLDEPTSGLDSAAAFFVMRMIRRLARGGRTIVSVIHQPSSEVFDLFDKLCLLASGHTVFFGDAANTAKHFADSGFPCPTMRNPADHFLRAINSDFDKNKEAAMDDDDVETQQDSLDKLGADAVTAKLIDTYKSSPEYTEVIAKVQSLEEGGGEILSGSRRDGPGFVSQSLTLTRRSFVNMARDFGIYWLRVGMYSMLMICIGTIYFKIGDSYGSIQARAAVLFFVVAFLTFMAIAGFPAFIEDMKVFSRERLNGHYGVLHFVISNTLSSMPFIFLISLISTLIAYWLIKLQNTFECFAVFVLLLFLSLAVVESLMMAIAAVVPNFLMGLAGGAGIMGMFMLVCGFFRLKDDLPAPVWRYPFHYISFHTYAFQGFMINEFDNLTFKPMQSGGPLVSGTEALAMFNIHGKKKWQDVDCLPMGLTLRRLCARTCSMQNPPYAKTLLRGVFCESVQQCVNATRTTTNFFTPCNPRIATLVHVPQRP